MAVCFYPPENIGPISRLSKQDVQMNKVDTGALAFVDAAFKAPELFYQKG